MEQLEPGLSVRLLGGAHRDRMPFPTRSVHLRPPHCQVIPPAAPKAINNSACCMMTWYDNGRPRPDYVCSYKDYPSMIETLRTATYVPGWWAANLLGCFCGCGGWAGGTYRLAWLLVL